MTNYDLKCLGYHTLSTKSMSKKMISVCQQYGITVMVARRKDLVNAGIDVKHDQNHQFAAANIETKTIIINNDGLNDMGLRLHEVWAMIWHEVGHIVLGTENEQAADTYAIKQLKDELGNDAGIDTYLGYICKTYIYHMMRRHRESDRYAFRIKYQQKHYKRFLAEVPSPSECDF